MAGEVPSALEQLQQLRRGLEETAPQAADGGCWRQLVDEATSWQVMASGKLRVCNDLEGQGQGGQQAAHEGGGLQLQGEGARSSKDGHSDAQQGLGLDEQRTARSLLLQLADLAEVQPELMEMIWRKLYKEDRMALRLSCRAGRAAAAAAKACLSLFLMGYKSRLSPMPIEGVLALQKITTSFPNLRSLCLSLSSHNTLSELLALLAFIPDVFSQLVQLVLAVQQEKTITKHRFLDSSTATALCQMLGRCGKLKKLLLVALESNGVDCISDYVKPSDGLFRLKFRPPTGEAMYGLGSLLAPPATIQSIIGSRAGSRYLVKLAVNERSTEGSLDSLTPTALAAAANLRSVQLHHVGADNHLQSVVAALTQVTKLNIFISKSKALPIVPGLGFTEAHKVRELEITFAQPLHLSDMTCLPKLEKLTLSEFGVSAGYQDGDALREALASFPDSMLMPELRTLQIEERIDMPCSLPWSSELIQSALHGRLLRALTAPKLEVLETGQPVPADAIMTLQHNRSHLSNLGVPDQYCTLCATGTQLVQVAACMPQLCEKIVELCDVTESQLLKAVRVNASALHSVTGVANTHVVTTDNTLLCLAKVCCNVEHLVAESKIGFTSAGLKALSTLSGLGSLRLEGCTALDDDAVTTLTTGCTKLGDLDLDGVEAVTEAAWLALRPKPPFKENFFWMVTLHGNHQLTTEGRAQLRAKGWLVTADWVQ